MHDKEYYLTVCGIILSQAVFNQPVKDVIIKRGKEFAMIHQRILFVFIIAFLFLEFSACSKNAIEGEVHSFGNIGPASKVRIKAETAADIKAKIDDASKEVATDGAGRFKISELLPSQEYRVHVVDDYLISTSGRIKPLTSGTLIMPDPIIIIPKVAERGVWFFPKGSTAFDTVKTASHKIQIGLYTGYRLQMEERKISIHEGMYEPAYINSKTNAFSFSDHDVVSFGRSLPRNGILVVTNPKAQIEQLYFINSMELPLYSAVSSQAVTIDEGWYYTVQDFYVEKKPLNEHENYIRGQNSFLKNHQFLRIDSLFVIDLESLKRGTYFLTTTYYAGNKWSIFRQEPSEGYIITLK